MFTAIALTFKMLLGFIVLLSGGKVWALAVIVALIFALRRALRDAGTGTPTAALRDASLAFVKSDK
jgi:hypothetical protein